MQTITRGSANTVVFTLTERVTLDSPYFLVKVNSRSTNITKRFILPANASGSTSRYDQFTITESTTEDLPNGTVSLTAGDWSYKIYEQASATNLNENLATTLIEDGILRVLGSSDTYVDSEQTTTYIDV